MGSIRVGGAKNASFKLMIAALFGDSPSRLLNFSRISDVGLVATIIKSLGGQAREIGERAYFVDPSNLSTFVIPQEFGQASRASTLFIPALLSRFGRAIVPLPGGDKIGVRDLDFHLDGFKALGAQVTVSENSLELRAQKLRGATYRFTKNTHTGTETLIMLAVKAEGRTILENAAQETEIDDLIAFLNSMGGKIKRLPNRVVQIDGVKNLHGSIHKIMSDQNQVVSFACAALATKGDVIVENANPQDIAAFLEKLDEIGAGYEIGSYGVRFFYKGQLQATTIETAIHPGFKTDWQPLWAAVMTQAKGESVIHETIYSQRFGYVDALNKMGANITSFKPQVVNPDSFYNFPVNDQTLSYDHAVRIPGPTLLTGGEFKVLDLRHGATLMIAGLMAAGQTTLHDPDNQISRGYEELHERLISMGATISLS